MATRWLCVTSTESKEYPAVSVDMILRPFKHTTMPDKPSVPAIFLDDVGVISDPAVRAHEWPRFVAEFFAPLLGGPPERWSEANPIVYRSLEPTLVVGPGESDYITWFRDRHITWLRGMAAYVGVSAPIEDDACALLARKATEYITERVRAEYHGVNAAVTRLHGLGFTLFTASGQNSWELEGYLKGMGIRQCFRSLFGADLINQGKYSPEYFRRVFEATGVNPENSLVVDDNPKCLGWAATLGARTCLIGGSPTTDVAADVTVGALRELPEVLERPG